MKKLILTKTRWLVTIILLTALGVGDAWGIDKILYFDFSDDDLEELSEWPTSESSSTSTETYELVNTYTFALGPKVYMNSTYLMLKYTTYMGLPAIPGYKLTGVEISNSSGCSTSTNVGISSSNSSFSAVGGGSQKTFSTKGSTYTYSLSSTSANTVYYIYVTSANCQIVDLKLTYAAASKFTVTFDGGTGTSASSSLTESSIGSGVTLPSATPPSDCSGDYSFMGWAEEEISADDEEPVMYFAGNKFYPENNCTLYAVYVKDKTATNYYGLISNRAQLQSGEQYIIEAYTGSKDYALKAAIVSSNYLDTKEITSYISDDTYYESTPDGNIIWTITKDNETTVSLYNSANSKYLWINTSSPYYLGLNASKKTFTLEWENHGEGYVGTFAFISSSRYVRYNDSYTDWDRQSTSDKNIYLYKRSYSGTFDTNPACSSCSAPTAVTKGSFNRGTQKMEIGWTGATNVDICFSKSTTKPASPQVTNTSTNPYSIDVSDYSATDKCYVWVRQNCGGGETSDWVAIDVSGNAYFYLPSHTLTVTATPASSGTFTKSPNVTSVVEGRTVSITASPAAGYNFSSWAVSGTNATLSSTSANPTTFTMGTANATVTATFTAKPLVSISLSPASGTVYVGQYAEFAITYNPADILTKGTTLVSTPSYVATTGTTNTTLKLTGGRAGVTITEDVTETVSIQANADNTKTASVSITVKPLPKVHFVDIVHSYEFSDVAGTIEDNALVSNKTTPTHAEYSGTGANDCETYHTRLVGWIEKTWADAHPDATHEDIINAGTGVFIETNAAINVLTYNGNTYYAVWAKLQ